MMRSPLGGAVLCVRWNQLMIGFPRIWNGTRTIEFARLFITTPRVVPEA